MSDKTKATPDFILLLKKMDEVVERILSQWDAFALGESENTKEARRLLAEVREIIG